MVRLCEAPTHALTLARNLSETHQNGQKIVHLAADGRWTRRSSFAEVAAKQRQRGAAARKEMANPALFLEKRSLGEAGKDSPHFAILGSCSD
jgi:hypothetical protein